MVRRVKSGTEWHPANDHLSGKDVYGTYVNDPKHDSTFSKSWDDFTVSHYLFSTGDESKWLVATKDAIFGESYMNIPRPILMSSLSDQPYDSKWFNRENGKGHPLISLTNSKDLQNVMDKSEFLYAENSLKVPHTLEVLPFHNGMNVWVKYSGTN